MTEGAAGSRLRIAVPDRSWREALADLADGAVEVVVWDGTPPQPEGRLDLVLRPYDLELSTLAQHDVSRIGVLQTQTLGYDGIADVLPEGGVVANAVGVHEAATAELAMALVLASTRNVGVHAREQATATWEPRWGAGLIDRTVLLLGVGGIGGQLLPRLAGFGAEVVRVGTTARDDDHGHVHGVDDLPDLLPTVDVVIVAVPLTSDTAGLVDDAFLEQLADGALVVNVARGPVVDADAVVRQAGRVAYASDVFAPEPLPSDHPLWTAPDVLMTPHVGGMSSSMRTRVERLVRRQVAHLLAGEPPDHVVIGDYAGDSQVQPGTLRSTQ